MDAYKHRNGLSDGDWARKQPKGKPNYAIGDIVKCHGGGIGVVDTVSLAHGGWPNTYALSPVWGQKEPPYNAWFYEGDFELIARGPAWDFDRK